MKSSLERLGVRSLNELMMHRVASRRAIEPLVEQTRYPANSDYFPVVDLNASRARFRRASAGDVAEIPRAFVPFESLIDGEARVTLEDLERKRPYSSSRSEDALIAAAFADFFLTGTSDQAARVPIPSRTQIALARAGLRQCDIDPSLWADAIEGTTRAIAQALRGKVLDRVFGEIWDSPCFKKLPAAERERIGLYRALAFHDVKAMREISDRLAAMPYRWSPDDLAVIALTGVCVRVLEGDLDGARVLWESVRDRIPRQFANALTTRIIVAHIPKLAEAAAPAPAAEAPATRATTEPPK
jgi:hypothetical protein